MKSEVRVGVIGAGYWGKNLIRNFSDLRALFSLCDADETVARSMGDKYSGLEIFSDEESLLSSSCVDAVVIATPAATHGRLVRKALDFGKHVFVEKPLCLDPNEALELARLADSKRLCLMVGHLLLYHPAFNALKEVVGKGELGGLRYIYSNRLNLGRIRREENALWSFAPHDISMILNLVGELPISVHANGGSYLWASVADTTLSHFTFSGQLQSHIFVSWLHPFKDHKLVVVGDRAMAVFDDVSHGPQKLLLYRHKIGWNGKDQVLDKVDGEPVPYRSDEPLALECKHFLECVESGRRPISDSGEGFRVLTVLDACQRSITSGQPVEI